jgi:hypothetical protein
MHNAIRRKQFCSAVAHGVMLPLCLLVLCAAPALAQGTTIPQGQDHPGAACPPSAGKDAPTVGKPDDKTRSDQLAQSKGVICPPAGVDPEMRQTPPDGGAMRVIPPPGARQNPGAQPK